MCFGPAASFTASGVLISLGAAVLNNVRARKEILFAAFPILFALQQLIEGFLWLALKKNGPEALLSVLTFSYLLFAYSLWPLLCPISVYAIEYSPVRRKILRLLILMGMATSFYLLLAIIINPVHASILHCGIRYETYVAGAHQFASVYMAATVLPYFISSHKSILVFGIPNFIFCVITAVFYKMAFISVWCFFAAILSLTLYFFLRKLHHQPILPILGKH